MEDNRFVLQAACVRAIIELYGDTSSFDDLPEPTFSAEFERKMQQLIAHVRHNRYHRLTRTAKIILVAAIIAVLAIATVIAAKQFGFSLVDKGNYSALAIEKQTNYFVAPIVCGYIPEGFILEEETIYNGRHEKTFVNGDAYILVEKDALFERVGVDTESRTPRKITYNGISYTLAGKEKHPIILWLNEKTQCLYKVYGVNIEENELLKVAYQTE